MFTLRDEMKIINLLRYRKHWLKFASELRPEFFSDSARPLFVVVNYYHSEFGLEEKVPTSNLRMIAKAHFKLKDEELKRFRLTVKMLRKYDREKERPVVFELIKSFIQRELIRAALVETVDSLDSPELDLGLLKDRVDRAVSLDLSNAEEVIPALDDEESMNQLDSVVLDDPIPVLIPKMDRYFQLCRGELAVVMALQGVGKTLAMSNFAVGYLEQGRVVLHATMELSGRRVAIRYYERFTGLTWKRIGTDYGRERLKKKLKHYRRAGGNLIIKDLCDTEPSILDLQHVLEVYNGKSKRPVDVVIVDYADLMRPLHRYKEKRFELIEIYKALRRMEQKEGCRIWTGSQVGKQSTHKKVIRLDDLAEAFAKANVADHVISLNQNEDELEDELVRIHIAKTRATPLRPTFPLSISGERNLLR